MMDPWCSDPGQELNLVLSLRKLEEGCQSVLVQEVEEEVA